MMKRYTLVLLGIGMSIVFLSILFNTCTKESLQSESDMISNPLNFSKRTLPDIAFSDLTGTVFNSHDSVTVDFNCDLINKGSLDFIPVVSKNFHLIRIIIFDLETGQFSEYWKNDFASTINSGDTDRYEEDGLRTFGRGRKAVYVKFMKNYEELSYRNNDFYFGFVSYADPTFPPATLQRRDNSLLTKEIKRRLSQY